MWAWPAGQEVFVTVGDASFSMPLRYSFHTHSFVTHPLFTRHLCYSFHTRTPLLLMPYTSSLCYLSFTPHVTHLFLTPHLLICPIRLTSYSHLTSPLCYSSTHFTSISYSLLTPHFFFTHPSLCYSVLTPSPLLLICSSHLPHPLYLHTPLLQAL